MNNRNPVIVQFLEDLSQIKSADQADFYVISTFLAEKSTWLWKVYEHGHENPLDLITALPRLNLSHASVKSINQATKDKIVERLTGYSNTPASVRQILRSMDEFNRIFDNLFKNVIYLNQTIKGCINNNLQAPEFK